METIRTTYTGELRTEATHVLSGTKIITDAPPDNHGKGEAFSPTDLMSASLGSCMLTIMGITGGKNGINTDGAKMKITKIMASEPRRVSEIHLEIEMGKNYTSDQKKILENAAINCPVAKSIHPDIKQQVKFIYPDSTSMYGE